jgi:hypothetical protein
VKRRGRVTSDADLRETVYSVYLIGLATQKRWHGPSPHLASRSNTIKICQSGHVRVSTYQRIPSKALAGFRLAESLYGLQGVLVNPLGPWDFQLFTPLIKKGLPILMACDSAQLRSCPLPKQDCKHIEENIQKKIHESLAIWPCCEL